MKILISGSTGLVGTALVDALTQEGHDLGRLVRTSASHPNATPSGSSGTFNVAWNPAGGVLDASANGAEAVVHLAGASIADGRWTTARKRILRDSRVGPTRHLVQALGQLAKPPKVFVAASAIGFYGDCGDEELIESSQPGEGFLAGICREWEAESAKAALFGARVVTVRFGIILARHGGALPRMLLPFRLGVGGRLGSGRQWMSWVALEDVIGMITRAIEVGGLAGPVNVVSPNPVRNSEFTAALGRVLHRPTIFPAPGFMLRAALGEMADALLLSSQRVLPQEMLASGYPFVNTTLEPALRTILGA